MSVGRVGGAGCMGHNWWHMAGLKKQLQQNSMFLNYVWM